MSAEALFDLWGLKFAKDGKKAVDFSATVKSLGLLNGLDTILEGRIRIMHTPERKAELEEALKGILEEGELTCKHLEQLRGRMTWFEGFVWGRQANSAIRALRLPFISESGVTVRKLSQAMFCSVLWISLLKGCEEVALLKLRPRFRSAGSSSQMALADKQGSVGSVLVDPSGRCTRYFSELEPDGFMRALCAESKNPIYELEVLPVLIAQRLWKSFLGFSQAVYYIDNEAARTAFIRGTEATTFTDRWVVESCRLEADLQIKS